MTTVRNAFLAMIVLCACFAVAQQSAAKPQPVLDVTSMDRSIDPCTDFYTYSCGGWMKKNPIPPDQSSWSTYGKVQDEDTAQLRDILQTAEFRARSATRHTRKSATTTRPAWMKSRRCRRDHALASISRQD